MAFLKKVKRKIRLLNKKFDKINVKKDVLYHENRKLEFKKDTEKIYGDSSKVLHRKSGKKISEVLIEFVHPLINDSSSNDDVKEIFGFGVLAWNMGILKNSGNEKEYNVFLNEIKRKGLSKEMESHLNDYINKKNSIFPQYKNLIVNYHISFTKNGMNVNVATNILPDENLNQFESY
jgi:hypothetical protein